MKFTNASTERFNFYILASRFQILLLRVDDLFVLQELISQLLPDQRTSIKFRPFLELVDVLRERLLCRKVSLDSTFLCVRTLRQVSLHVLGSEMNLTLSFLRGLINS